jgi:hypothetical protein
MTIGRKTGGRTAGTPNKLNGDIKAMIVGALTKLGGERFLIECARKNPTAFLGLVGRVLPLQVAGTDRNGEATTLTFEWAAATAPHERDNGTEAAVADDTLH